MSKYGADDLTISVGGTDLSNYIDTMAGFKVTAHLQEGTAFGDSWVEQLFTGLKEGNSFTVEGFYDDTATTGPDAILNAIGTSVAIILTWGSTKTSSFSALIEDYERTPTKGELTRFIATLHPTGTVTEA